ncbi:MAG: HlyD family efflux transporter periplasmic adaptor subunit [Planctomycetes bacterium]|nr:HlyD family efflux transporter periplasmic adaptor subunit [Planctomycetota bacterium]
MSHVDLSALRMGSEAPALGRRPIGPRLLTAAVVLLVLAVALTFAWPLLSPARAVPMAQVRTAEAAGNASNAVAEAVGWVEPDPFPVIVRPLVEGRIESIEVLEGTPVKAGETVLATLASAELQAAHERAAATVAEREREHAAAVAAHELARARLQQKAELRSAVAEARAAAAEAEAKLAAATGAARRSAAAAQGADAALAAQEQLAAAGSSNQVALARARAEQQAARAEAEAAAAEHAASERGAAAAAAALQLAEELLAAPVDLEHGERVAAAEAGKAGAALAAARTELAIAERELGWTTVVAPVDGVVLKLLAVPGAGTGPEGEGILSLYDRAHLRARIDVPLGTMSGVADAQPVELKSEITGSLLVRGVVQRVQHESDLLKNTLQVKIGLVDPPALWRPETLVRARFLGTQAAGGASAAAAFRVPKAAVRNGMVFAFDPARGRARAIAVTVVQEDGDGAIVRGELAPAMRVILADVADGENVQEVQR